MIIMSLRDGDLPSKQSPDLQGGCFATCARNDMAVKVHAFPLAAKRLGDDVRESQVKGGEELRSFFGRTLMASILDKAFKDEL